MVAEETLQGVGIARLPKRFHQVRGTPKSRQGGGGGVWKLKPLHSKGKGQQDEETAYSLERAELGWVHTRRN